MRLTPCHSQTMLWLGHGDARSQPAGHPGCAARRRQRGARRPALAPEPIGDEPGAGALARDDGRSAVGQGGTWPSPHTSRTRTARARWSVGAGLGRSVAPGEKAQPQEVGSHLHPAHPRRLCGELRPGADCPRKQGRARRAPVLRAKTGQGQRATARWCDRSGYRRDRTGGSPPRYVCRPCSATASSVSCARGIP